MVTLASHRTRLSWQMVLAMPILSLVLLTTTVSVARAATFTVPCDPASLIAAINQANTLGGANILELSAGCVYTFTTGYSQDSANVNALPKITSDLTINGHNAILQRGTQPNSNVPQFRFFQVLSRAALRLNDVTLRYGRVRTDEVFKGGAIYATEAIVSFNRSTFTDNYAGCGGVIALSPTDEIVSNLTVLNSVLANNTGDA